MDLPVAQPHIVIRSYSLSHANREHNHSLIPSLTHPNRESEVNQ